MFDLSVYLANVGAEREDWPREKLLVSSSFKTSDSAQQILPLHIWRELRLTSLTGILQE